MLLKFFYQTKAMQNTIFAVLILTLSCTASIVTVHTFMYELRDKKVLISSAQDRISASMLSELQTANSHIAVHDKGHVDCHCQPVQCQSIMAQIDLSSDGISLPFIDVTHLNPISYIQSQAKTAAYSFIVVNNARLNPTDPPINIRYQSFLI